MDRLALEAAYMAAVRYLENVPARRVGARADVASMRAELGGPLPERGEPAARVVEQLARSADPGIVASAGPRFFGFVIGGSLPAAVGADWLTSAWDQNAGLFVLSPAAAIVEDTVLEWLTDLFGLPPGTGIGFVTGGQMANTTCLAAARHSVLARVGWDAAAKGLIGAPAVAVILGDEAHVTVYGALRLLGLGDASAIRVACDNEGRMVPDAVRDALRAAKDRPTIVCSQVGNVNTGSFDPLARIVQLVREHDNAWLHVDGAFGLWAAASPRYKHHLVGLDGADSWATDAHKWLNVPYDNGLAFVRDRDAHCGLSAALKQRARQLPVDGGILPASARLFGVRRLAIAGTCGTCRTGRALLRARACVRRAAPGGTRSSLGERSGPQPGPGPLRAPR